jgi:hypothetical protein
MKSQQLLGGTAATLTRRSLATWFGAAGAAAFGWLIPKATADAAVIENVAGKLQLPPLEIPGFCLLDRPSVKLSDGYNMKITPCLVVAETRHDLVNMIMYQAGKYYESNRRMTTCKDVVGVYWTENAPCLNSDKKWQINVALTAIAANLLSPEWLSTNLPFPIRASIISKADFLN